jgi:two-component system sensor histidine kinase KdpD
LLDVSRDLPFVKVDQILIEQALGQILDNATKYSPSGTAIKVMARNQDERVVISVTDQGAGLTRAEQERLWDRFYRGERHLMTVTGSGLGLWIAHAFIVANGGKLEAVSEGAGCGTMVTISLPAHIDAIPKLADGSDE